MTIYRTGQEHKITVNGITMRWEESGEGIPIIFIHGIPTTPTLWRHVIPLVKNARCLNWEMVGYGDSIPEGRNRDISVAKQADYLLDWADAIGVKKAILAAQDLGGGVALIAALKRRNFCTGLFLTNAVGYDSWPIPIARFMQRFRYIFKLWPNSITYRLMKRQLQRSHDNHQLAQEALEAHWPYYERHGGASAFANQLASLDNRDTMTVASQYPTLDMPVRLVWGTADRHQDKTIAERFARDFGVRPTYLEGAQHYTPEDRPDDVALGINELLEEVRAMESVIDT